MEALGTLGRWDLQVQEFWNGEKGFKYVTAIPRSSREGAS